MTLPQTYFPYPLSGRLELLTPKLLGVVARQRTLDEALTAVAQGFVDDFGAVAANVRVLRADGRTLELVSARGLGAEEESPKVDLADGTPAAWAVRKHSTQFLRVELRRGGARNTRARAHRSGTLFSLPVVGDERVLGAISGCFDVPLSPSDREQLAELGKILGALLEVGLLNRPNIAHLDSPHGRESSQSGFWRREMQLESSGVEVFSICASVELK